MESRRASMDDIGGGGEYSNVDARVLACYAEQGHQFKKGDGSLGKKAKGAGVCITYQTEAGKVLEDYFDLGTDFLPAESAEDADAGVSASKGDFITRIEGSTRKFSPTFGWGIMLAALKKIGFPLTHIDEHGLGCLVDHVFHLVNQKGNERDKPTATGQTHYFTRVPSEWHSSFIIEAQGGTTKKDNGAHGEKPGIGAQKSGNGIETRLRPIIVGVLEDAGGSASKAKLTQLIGPPTSEWTDADKQAAGMLILKNEFYQNFPGVVLDGVKVKLEQ